MSGHSKWATIHRQKEVNDAKRGVIFTKLGKALAYAARQGKGVDDMVAKARQYNMPRENIARAIERGMGVVAGEELHEATYEGFAPGGVAVMVHTVSDNKLRTAQQVREILDKGGGKMVGQGAVAYLFSVDMKPNFLVEVVDVEMRQKIETLLKKLEDLDDVQKVFTNYA